MQIGPFVESDCHSFRNKHAIVKSYINGKTGILNVDGQFEVPQDLDDISPDFPSDKLVTYRDGKRYAVEIPEDGAVKLTPYSPPAVKSSPRPSDAGALEISEKEFEDARDLFASSPVRNYGAAPMYREPREKVFDYLCKHFGFIGMDKRTLELRLGKGSEQMPQKWFTLACPDSRYALSYSLTPGATCGNASASVTFSINGEGHVDGYCIGRMGNATGWRTKDH